MKDTMPSKQDKLVKITRHNIIEASSFINDEWIEMQDTSMREVTRILDAIPQGDPQAIDDLLPAVYKELRALADQKLLNERKGHTLQATALVHEAYIRLSGAAGSEWKSRTYFFGAAAEAMRRILIDNARRKMRLKRGGDRVRRDLNDEDLASVENSDDLIALDEALAELAIEDPTKAELVKLRYFAGLSIQQSAEILNISTATAKRYWTYARAWLYGRIRSEY
jgi:RNA polymerase sigma factor (TIGR02999 family)